MLKKITLKGIRDSFSSKFALSPSRSTGNLDNVVSTAIADDDEDDDIGKMKLTVKYLVFWITEYHFVSYYCNSQNVIPWQNKGIVAI